MKKLLFVLCGLAMYYCAFAADGPDATYLFAKKDTAELYLDIYEPSVIDSSKPTVIYIFGGGFIRGNRDQERYRVWFDRLGSEGYRCVSIDYRLGLKGVTGGMGLSKVKQLKNAITIAVEDLFSATLFLIENANTLGIDPENIVVSGSSAGAITALQAEWEISNGGELASVLPEGFNYKGVMSFAGAIFSDKGPVKFAKEPCPILLLHGTSDKIVNYNSIEFMNLHFCGSNYLSKVLDREDRNYRIYRFKGHNHEIAGAINDVLPYELDFLERNVVEGKKVVIDALVDDPDAPSPDTMSNKLSDLYEK